MVGTAAADLLPAPIAARLKSSGEVIADRHVAVTVLFADIVGFTPLSAELEPEDLVALLDEVVSRFDALTEARSLEKIRTIGDAYMVAAGVPDARADHALAAVDLAPGHAVSRGTAPTGLAGPGAEGGHRLRSRRGRDYRPLEVPVRHLGRHRDHGEPHGVGRTAARSRVTEATYELVRDRYECVPRPTVEVKGKGVMRTWLVVGPWAAAASDGLPPPTGA